jgi:VIT1/CCC1 family predicted Fe2+/Mn2+ transporter
VTRFGRTSRDEAARTRRKAREHTKSSNPVSRRRTPERLHVSAAPINVVDQVRIALKPRYRLATCLGFLLGGFVPLASFFVAHYELSNFAPLYTQKGLYLVLGGLAYSARTVWQWGRVAFNNAFKAAGFVVLVEGVMVSSHIGWLSVAALVYLVAINGIVTGCHLSAPRRPIS